MTGRLVPAAALVVVVTDATLLATGVIGPAAALALFLAAGIELVAVHLLAPWPTLRLILDLLGIYALLMILGLLAGRIVRPHLIVGGELVLRSGPHVCARVPLSYVTEVRRDRRLSPTSAAVETDGDRGILALPGPDGTSLTVVLARPVEAAVPGMPWAAPETRQVSEVRLHIDDDDAARLLREAVPAA